MKFSYNWLKEIVDAPVDARALSQELTMAGMKLEGIEEVPGDFVLDFEIPVNRPDCLSIYGLSREISAIFDVPMKGLPEISQQATERVEGPEGYLKDAKYPLRIRIEDPQLCLRYCGQVVSDVKIGPSPEWIRRRLEGCGVRSINNVVDVTNYVMLELGQPLHAFDYDRLAEHTIRVRQTTGENLLMIDAKQRSLKSPLLVIADALRPQAVGGVMGGKESEVSEQTSTILLESAYFQPTSIRKTAKILELSTDASYRFERGADPEMQAVACRRAAFLLEKIAAGKAHTLLDVAPGKFQSPEIHLRTERVERILGKKIEEDFIVKTLKSLGFVATPNSTWRVPSFRVDVHREIDLIEEIARLYGYNRFPDTLPAAEKPYQEDYPTFELERAFSEILRAVRIDEACSYSFRIPSSPAELEHEAIRIKNPITESASELRTSLIPGLVESIEYNLRHKNEMLGLFEIGRVFLRNGEKTMLAIVSTADYRELKGIIENSLPALLYPSPRFENGEILIGKQRIGKILSLQLESTPVYSCEISLTDLIQIPKNSLKYRPIIPFPSVERDVSFLLDESLPYSSLENIFRKLMIPELRSYKLIDRYKGPNTPPGKISLTLRLIFQSENRTLTSEEVDALYARIINEFKSAFGAELRK
jgi:phenylalanyl-tRNA synthetase beta chain